ncbi:MAG: hypothetical protein Q9181_000267 [Wetmoreana brouardii]
MAKTRPEHAAKGKEARTVSTSAIFKKHDDRPSHKDGQKRLGALRLFPSPDKGKPNRKSEHPLSVAFSESVEMSRQSIEEKTLSRLDNARDKFVTQTRGIIQQARDRVQEADNSTKDLQKPIDDELLELTRKDGTTITVTLGKRMTAYRKLVNREQERLKELFEQWAEVTKEINSLATKLFGQRGVENFLKDPCAENLGVDDAERRGLMAELEAEKERVRSAALVVGGKAVEAMKASEKDLETKHRTRMLQLCNSIFAEDDDEATG